MGDIFKEKRKIKHLIATLELEEWTLLFPKNIFLTFDDGAVESCPTDLSKI